MKYINRILTVVMFFVLLTEYKTSNAQANGQNNARENSKFRVVGYLTLNRKWSGC
jgi:hypothetical protein